MTQLLINGIERSPPIGTGENFSTLLRYVHESLASDTSLVSSIRVDGKEINAHEEAGLFNTPLTEIGSVEITFCHPRELAEETLQILKTYTTKLSVLSKEIAEALTAGQNADHDFVKLVDGIQVFADGIAQVRMILKAGSLIQINILDADLISVLSDLLLSQQNQDTQYKIALLSEHLPANLEQWAVLGIPALIRCRDN